MSKFSNEELNRIRRNAIHMLSRRMADAWLDEREELRQDIETLQKRLKDALDQLAGIEDAERYYEPDIDLEHEDICHCGEHRDNHNAMEMGHQFVAMSSGYATLVDKFKEKLFEAVPAPLTRLIQDSNKTWATYAEWKERGRYVRQGERSTGRREFDGVALFNYSQTNGVTPAGTKSLGVAMGWIDPDDGEAPSNGSSTIRHDAEFDGGSDSEPSNYFGDDW